MIRLCIIILIAGTFLFSACGCYSVLSPVITPVITSVITPIPTVTAVTPNAYYYVDGSFGSDTNPGSEMQPWQTIEKATQNAIAGDMIYVRGGIYTTEYGGWQFANSGMLEMPITIANYPGEQIEIRVEHTEKQYGPFGCWYSLEDPDSWQTPKADFIRIIGSTVAPNTLSNGVLSQKGIVVRGMAGAETKASGVEVTGCDNWEVAGVDFMGLKHGIFTKKRNFSTVHDYSPDNWYVHDNRVYGFYGESGMQFNGNNNLIENNQIYKVTNTINTPYGCTMLNLLGNNNLVRGNEIDSMGSTAGCLGILLEWDLSDANIIENNIIAAVGWGKYGIISIAGGDNNIIRDNVIAGTVPEWLYVWEGTAYPNWPCNEESDAKSILPANDPTAPDYEYFYNPRNCFSEGNQVYNNVYTDSLPESSLR